jgi:CBS domain-containing protein
MKIGQLMSQDILVARPDDSIRVVAEQMARLDVGALPVCDGRRLLGMITDRDIVVRGVAFGRSPDTTAGAIMTRDVKYCFEDDDVEEVCQRMGEAQIRRIPVLDRNHHLVGIVSLGDLALEAKNRAAGRALEQISQPNRPH